MRTALFALVTCCFLLLPGYALPADVSDNFDDNIKNKTIWGKDTIYGYGVLTEINQRLEYTVLTPTAEDAAKRLLIARGPYNADWQAQIDLYNSTNPTKNNQLNSYGIDLYHCEDSNDWLYAELYSSYSGGPPTRKAFFMEFATNDIPSGQNVTGDLAGSGVLTGSIQMAFDSTAKVISVYYAYSGGGWVPFGSFGISRAGGTIANGNWQMTDGHQFCMRVYGYSENMAVGGGKMYGDNFAATGVVAPVTTHIMSPVAGEIVPAGDPYTIMWEAPATAMKFKLKYSMDNGTTWQAVAPGFLAGTSYNWQVPEPSKNKRACLLKLIGYNDSNVKIGADVSDAPFTIEVLKLAYPNGGETFTAADQPIITWVTNPNVANVDHIVLSYTLNNGLIWKKIDTTSDPSDDGSFTWTTVPVLGQTKTKCKVMIVLKNAAGKTLGSDVSDAPFSIGP